MRLLEIVVVGPKPSSFFARFRLGMQKKIQQNPQTERKRTNKRLGPSQGQTRSLLPTNSNYG